MTPEQEANAVKMFIQGSVLSEMYSLRKFLKIADISQDYAEDGGYTPFFDVTFESGLQIRVMFGLMEYTDGEKTMLIQDRSFFESVGLA